MFFQIWAGNFRPISGQIGLNLGIFKGDLKRVEFSFWLTTNLDLKPKEFEFRPVNFEFHFISVRTTLHHCMCTYNEDEIRHLPNYSKRHLIMYYTEQIKLATL